MRVVTLSDTHQFRPEIPDGDVLIHAGDIASRVDQEQLWEELRWLGGQSHRRKFYVPGNHDYSAFSSQGWAQTACSVNGIVLVVDRVQLIGDLRMYGSPWTPRYGWTQGYMYDKDHAWMHWDYLRRDTSLDILVTHGPAYSVLDGPEMQGDVDLLMTVRAIKPRVHIFGHNHDDGGIVSKDLDTGTLSMNVAFCGPHPEGPAGRPIRVFDITKDKVEIVQ